MFRHGFGFNGNFFQPFSYGYPWYNFGGIIMGAIFLILIGVIIFLLVKRSKVINSAHINNQRVTGTNRLNEALEIAKLRFARGEISTEEYQELIKVLNS